MNEKTILSASPDVGEAGGIRTLDSVNKTETAALALLPHKPSLRKM